MAFRFIHTADWQIGKPFGNFPDEARYALRGERLRAVERIADHAREAAVDAVLVAGDVFDSNAVADKTLAQAIDAMRGYTGRWILLPGNHDAALPHSVWSRLRASGLPDNFVIADEPIALDLWAGSAIVLPAPLRRRREAADLSEWFDHAPSPAGAIRIGLAHGSVANRLPGESEAANAIAEDRAARADLAYLALGDWHGALAIAPNTHYSGTPEADRFRDNEPGSIHLVTIEGPGAGARVERVRIGRFAWLRLEVELLDGTAAKAIEAMQSLAPAPRDSVVALTLAGTISLAERRRLDLALQGWDARLHHLAIDDSALKDEPTADDLDAIDTTGFVRAAVERLKTKAADPLDAEAAAARMALRMIYLDHLAQER